MDDCERPPAMCPGCQVLEGGGVTNTQTGYLLSHQVSRGGLVSRLGDSKAAFLSLCAMPSPGSQLYHSPRGLGKQQLSWKNGPIKPSPGCEDSWLFPLVPGGVAHRAGRARERCGGYRTHADCPGNV